MDDEDMLTLSQAAKILQLSPRTVRQLVAEGEIPAWTPTRNVIRISRRALMKRVEPPEDPPEEMPPGIVPLRH